MQEGIKRVTVLFSFPDDPIKLTTNIISFSSQAPVNNHAWYNILASQVT